MAEQVQRKSSDTIPSRRAAGSIKQNETFASANELEAQSTHTQDGKGNDVADGDQAQEDGDDDAIPQVPESIAETIRRIHFYIWWLLGVILLAIPLIISATALRSVRMHGVSLEGLFIWLEIMWTALWASYFLAWGVSTSWDKICDEIDLEGYADIFNGLRLPMMLLVTNIVAWVTIPTMYNFDHGNYNAHWITLLRKILLATIPVSAIFFVKTAIIELIVARCSTAVLYSKKKFLTRGINGIYALLALLNKDKPPKSRARKLAEKVREKLQELGGWKYLALNPWKSPDERLFLRYLSGEGKDEEFVGENDIGFIYRRLYFGKIPDEALATVPIKPTNWKPGTKRKLRFTAIELLQMFDYDGNKEISLLELVNGAVDIFRCTRDVMKGIRGVQAAAFSVDLVVSAIMLIIVALVYAAFFTHNINAYFTPLWTTFTGISFALGGTVTEFFTCCAFVFSKQPYSVGDRVTIEGKDDGDLIVDEISLTYTVFHRVKDGIQDQLTNIEANNKWIANISRSRNRREDVVVATGPNFSPSDEVDLEDQLKIFIQGRPGCSRYLQPPEITIRINAEKLWEVQLGMSFNSSLGHVEEELLKHRDAVIQRLSVLVTELQDEKDSQPAPESDDQAKTEPEVVATEQQQEVDTIEPAGLVQRKTSSASKASKK